MGSRGSDYRRRENVVDLYKALDKAYDEAFDGSHNKEALDEWIKLNNKLKSKGLADDYFAWLVSGSPSEWTPTKTEPEAEQNSEPEPEPEPESTTETTTETNETTTGNAPNAERMANAMYAKSKQEAESHLLPSLQQVWPTLTEDEKIAVRSYTGKLAGELNNYLWNGVEPGSYSTTKEFYGGDIIEPLDILTSALNKSSLPEDTWLERGLSMNHLYNFLGIKDVAEITDLIDSGQSVTHKGFMSTSSGDFSSYAKSEQVLLKVFAPKGTPGMYVNPISKYGDNLLGLGNKISEGTIKGALLKDWDGQTTHLSGSEHETILQRGLNFKVMGQESKNGKLVVTIAVVE